MADVEERVFDQLSTATGLAALVSSRVYPTELPQNATLPAVTYVRHSTDRDHAMGSDPGNVHALFRVTYWHSVYFSAIAGIDEVRAALSRYSVTTGSTVVEDCFLSGERHGIDPERAAYSTSLDFHVHYRE